MNTLSRLSLVDNPSSISRDGVAHREAQASQGLSNVPYFPVREYSSFLDTLDDLDRIAQKHKAAPLAAARRGLRSARYAESITMNIYPGMMEIGVKMLPMPSDNTAADFEGFPEGSIHNRPHPDDKEIVKSKRGKVTGFSRKAQNNLRKYMNKVTGLDRAVFATLTYPNEFPASSRRWKRDVKVFKARFEREYEAAGGIWRMELKQRKSGSNRGMVAPHFHLLIVGIDDLSAFREWLSLVWYEVVESGDEKHFRAGTNAVRVENQRHAMWYVAKYISKNEDDALIDVDGSPVAVGRFWGKLGSIDTLPVFTMRVNFKQLVALRRVAAGWLKAADHHRFARIIKRGKLGFSMFGWGVDDPDVIEGSIGGQALRCIGFDDLILFAVTLGAEIGTL